jgi:hypothetical protein
MFTLKIRKYLSQKYLGACKKKSLQGIGAATPSIIVILLESNYIWKLQGVGFLKLPD